jgi:hypothetical protein
MEGVAKDTTAVAAAAPSSSEQSSSAEEKRIPAKQFMSVQRVQRADGIVLRTYESDSDMKVIMQMMERDLSGERQTKRVFFVFLFFCFFFVFFFF